MHWENMFREVAAEQEGVVGRDQLREMGATIDQWWSARRSGRWEVLTPRVLAVAGSPPSDGKRVHAAMQDAGGRAALHGPSALAWCDVPGFDLAEIHAVRTRGTTTTGCDLATIHRLRDLEPDDVIVIHGVRTVRPLRAIWSEASRYCDEHRFKLGVGRIGRVLDNAHLRGLVSWEELHRSLDDLRRRGRAGSCVMAAAAEIRQPGTSPTESRNEDRFEEIVAEALLEPFLRQVHIGSERIIGRADFADERLKFVVEVNSMAYHSLPSDQRADEPRYAAMARDGYVVGVVWETDLWKYAADVEELVRIGRAMARRGDTGAIHTPSCPWPSDSARVIIGGSPPLRG